MLYLGGRQIGIAPDVCMNSNRVKVGSVGLGRWAKVLTRAARSSPSSPIVATKQTSRPPASLIAPRIAAAAGAAIRAPSAAVVTS